MPKPAGYTRLQIALHWIMFLMVAAQFLLHDAIVAAWIAFKKGEAIAFSPMVTGHVVGGTVILLLAVWRISIKIKRGSPPLPANESRLQQIIAHATHGLLYLLMLLMPMSGLVAWFGNVDLAADAHSAMRIVFIILILLHFLGALYHRFILKSGVMERMLRPQ